uniref:DUF2917 domain-containing protein n=1 Tax=mine drainage metagenome TaxID=410659 RepID=E6PPA5_9ZZZZ
MNAPLPSGMLLSLRPQLTHRIEDACGICVRVLQGLVWLTEEGELDDVFLGEGDAYQIRGSGRVLVEVETTTRGRHVATLEIVDMPERSGRPQEQPQGQSEYGDSPTSSSKSKRK